MKLVGQACNQAAKPISAFFEVWDFNEFVGGVGLIDRSRAEANRGNAGICKMGGIGKPWSAGEDQVGVDGFEATNPGMVGFEIHRRKFHGFGDFRVREEIPKLVNSGLILDK